MAAGGGFINDIFRPHARRVLRTLATAQAAGALTALVGQGIGPLTDRALRKQVASVLPKLDLFTLREDGVSSSLLRGLKVPADRIDITGDDAIELAYLQRSRRLGQSIGVNIRAAQYANISAHAVTVIQQTLRVISGRLSATLVPVPILIGRHHSTPPDAIAIAEIVRNSVNLPDLPDPTAPVDAIRRVNHCRIVVTGSYHAAVFALSQGRPAVCLAGSQYYMDKFAGLARAFGAGCEVVALEAPDLASRLAASLESAWHAAERMQPLLLAAAERQINRGMSAYGRLFALAKSVHKQIDACAEAAVCTATVQINADVAGK